MFFETTRFHRTTRPTYLSYASFTEATTPDYGLLRTQSAERDADRITIPDIALAKRLPSQSSGQCSRH
ncbi:MAG: hypothetical protein ABTQ25_16070 [Nitrosomonas ureae]